MRGNPDHIIIVSAVFFIIDTGSAYEFYLSKCPSRLREFCQGVSS